MKKLKQLDPRYKIDESRKVFVYKNLHKDCWSIKQDGLVKAHTTDLCLFDCSFRVNKKGREKVLEQKRKNVHAGISGYIEDRLGVIDARNPYYYKYKLATYNPYKYTSFVRIDNKEPVFWSSSVRMTKNKVHFVPCIDSANKL